MPRQDVPYGGAICRLKERIAEIWDRLDEKLHSINGVGGDGAGNVEIVSGDAAITVSESPTGHFIEIGLDHGNLPSAAVSSVNGQTGTVRLDAADIPSDGNSNVQADIAANKAAINECFDAITSEQLARQNADAALQGNINSVQASIPGAAAAAVSNDPTVAQLAADVPGKLDKITSGSALKAYTHTGEAQGETAVVNGIDANSIGLRDANGRMQAADPAAGVTDKTLVTANWVSQTGDDAPNNLIHKNGNETKNGTLQLNNGYIAYRTDWHSTSPIATPLNSYCIFVKITQINAGHYAIFDFVQGSNNATEAGRLMLRISPNMNPIWLFRKSRGGNANLSNPDNIVCLTDGIYYYLAWKRTAQYGTIMCTSYIQNFYGIIANYDRNIEWLDANSAIVTDDLSAYTVVSPID